MSEQKKAVEYARSLLDELNRLVEASKADVLNIDLDDSGLSGEEAEAVRLFREIIKRYRLAAEYNRIKYQLANDALNVALWDVDIATCDPYDPDNQFAWSQKFRHMLGFSDESDFPNRIHSWSERIHPEDKARVFKALAEHLYDYSGRTPFDVAYHIKSKNGEYRYWHAYGTSLRDSAGVPLRIAGAVMDITEKEQMQEALREALSESKRALALMTNVLNKSSAMIYVTDPCTNEILFINDYMKDHFGITGDVTGQACYKVFQSGMNARCDWCPCHKLDKYPDKTIVWEEYNVLTNSYYRNTDRYIDWPGGKTVHIQHSVDFTDIKKIQDKLEHNQKGMYAMNSAASLLLNAKVETFENALYHSMKIIAEAVKIDRMYIWKNSTADGQLYCTQVYEWSENVEPQQGKEFTLSLPYKTFPRWEKELSGGRCINIIVRDALPEEQAILHPQGILSLLAAPVYIDDRFWGFVGFDDCRHERIFTEEEESILRSSSLLFTNAWLRNEMITNIRTTSKKLEEALAQATAANQNMTLMLDGNPLICILRDENNTILDCNQEALSVFGVPSKADLINTSHNFYPEFQPDGLSSAEKIKSILKDLIEKRTHDSFEWTFQNMEGEEFPVETKLVLIQWHGSHRILSYSRDLREIKRQEQQRLEAEERAQSLAAASKAAQIASQAKSEFLARMSHELRTPLNAVIGFLGLELQKEQPQETADNLETALDAGYNLLHLINDILDISKIEAGRFEVINSDYYIAGLINDLAALSTFRTGPKDIEFRVEADENMPSVLHGDDLRIKQVLNNLLCNAFKYTENGTVTLSVGLEPGEGEQSGSLPIRFSVRDTGKGIMPENLGSLFDSYARFDMKNNRLIEGTGLGLAISKSLVEAMGGQIHVESEYGEGSVFSCVIPQAVIDPKPIGPAVVHDLANILTMPKRDRRKYSDPWQCSYMPYARVLVVDDVPANLAIAKGMLQRYGITVDCVSTGQQALDMFGSRKNRYDAIFMDHMMPGMDGVETLRRIRAIGGKAARSVPVIILTANVMAGNDEAFLEQGFQAFLGKPIDPSQLDAVINRWVKDPRKETRLRSPRRRRGDASASGLPADSKEKADACLQAKSSMNAHAVEGLDMQEAVSRFGSEALFFDILRTYAISSAQLLEQMRGLPETDLENFVIMAHGIKGASYGVGANALGDMAKELECAAMDNDWQKVRKTLPPFLETTDKLLREINGLLHERMPDAVAEEDKPLKAAPDAGELAALYKASLSCSHSVIEEHLRKLEQYRYESRGELIALLRTHTDALDYRLISERLAEFAS